jgi:hypothetical protein
MLHMLSLDVADTCCWVLQTLIFNVADVDFRCCRHVMLGFVSRKTGGELLMLDDVRCYTQRGSQHDRTMGEERRKTHDVGSRNVLATFTHYTLDLTADD